MRDDKAVVIPLHMHPSFQERHRVKELKHMLLAETLAFTQVALDNAARPGPTPAAVKILERACNLMEEARNRLVLDLL